MKLTVTIFALIATVSAGDIYASQETDKYANQQFENYANSAETYQTAQEQQQQALHSSQPAQSLHSSQPEQTLHSSHPAQYLHSSQPAQTLHSSHPAQYLHSSHPAQYLHSSQPAQTLYSSQPEQTLHSSHPAQYLHSSQPEQTLHSSHPAQYLHSSQPAQTLYSSQPEQTLHSSHPAQYLHSSQPEQTLHSRRLAQYLHSSQPAQTLISEQHRSRPLSTARITNYIMENIGHNYHYLYETENGIKAQQLIADQGAGANTQGAFSYLGQDGHEYALSYTADENGFRPQGDHLPTPPPIPEAILKALEQNARDEAAGIYDDGSYVQPATKHQQQLAHQNQHYQTSGQSTASSGSAYHPH